MFQFSTGITEGRIGSWVGAWRYSVTLVRRCQWIGFCMVWIGREMLGPTLLREPTCISVFVFHFYEHCFSKNYHLLGFATPALLVCECCVSFCGHPLSYPGSVLQDNRFRLRCKALKPTMKWCNVQPPPLFPESPPAHSGYSEVSDKKKNKTQKNHEYEVS